MAKELGISLGKLNYCINALVKKGLIKIENFKKKILINFHTDICLPQRGIALKINLTITFMKKKMAEYDELKNEFEKNNNKLNLRK